MSAVLQLATVEAEVAALEADLKMVQREPRKSSTSERIQVISESSSLAASLISLWLIYPTKLDGLGNF